MISKKIPQEDIDDLRVILLTTKPSDFLRLLANKYKITCSDLSILINYFFEDVSLKEVTTVWHWDLFEKKRGYTDEELNNLFLKLKKKKAGSGFSL